MKVYHHRKIPTCKLNHSSLMPVLRSLNLSDGTRISNPVVKAYFHSFSLVLWIIIDFSLDERAEGFDDVGLKEGDADQAEIFPGPDVRGRETVGDRFAELVQLGGHLVVYLGGLDVDVAWCLGGLYVDGIVGERNTAFLDNHFVAGGRRRRRGCVGYFDTLPLFSAIGARCGRGTCIVSNFGRIFEDLAGTLNRSVNKELGGSCQRGGLLGLACFLQLQLFLEGLRGCRQLCRLLVEAGGLDPADLLGGGVFHWTGLLLVGGYEGVGIVHPMSSRLLETSRNICYSIVLWGACFGSRTILHDCNVAHNFRR
mmetsp:Transcript_18320/g.43423  ORF Transcript_18320/g.43423 Transcript_18320/m.43423 type:complete len:311 (+) Transcript_18320:94-1026(+)